MYKSGGKAVRCVHSTIKTHADNNYPPSLYGIFFYILYWWGQLLNTVKEDSPSAPSVGLKKGACLNKTSTVVSG